MDALFQMQSNELSTTTQKDKLFKDAERQWNTLLSEKGVPGRKVDRGIYKSILYNLEINLSYLLTRIRKLVKNKEILHYLYKIKGLEYTSCLQVNHL